MSIQISLGQVVGTLCFHNTLIIYILHDDHSLILAADACRRPAVSSQLVSVLVISNAILDPNALMEGTIAVINSVQGRCKLAQNYYKGNIAGATLA
jgi:hypothetical protein